MPLSLTDTRSRPQGARKVRDTTKTSWTNASLPDLSDALQTVLLMDTAPVGVHLIRTAEEFDATAFPVPPMPVHYCSAVKMAAEGASLKLALADMSCNTAPRTLGLQPGFHDPDFVESYITSGLYADREAAERILADVVTLQDMAGVALGPLDAFSDDTPPDVVIVSTLPYGAMRLAQAVSFSGNRIGSNAIGMHGICSECTAAPYATGEIHTSLMCSGTRYVAGWNEQLVSAGIPFGQLADVVEGLMRTAQRYEPDERKAAMRTSCRRVMPPSGRLAEEIGVLSDREGYFYSK